MMTLSGHCHVHPLQYTKQPSWPMLQSRADAKQMRLSHRAAPMSHTGYYNSKTSLQPATASCAFIQQSRVKRFSGFCGCQRRQPRIVCNAEPALPRKGLGPLQDDRVLPLNGKRVMITAPRQYASKLALLLISAGARPVWVPSIRVTRIEDEEDSLAEKQLKNLFQFDHVVFTSKNGIVAVFEKLTELHGSGEAALKAVMDSKAYFWALGADAEFLRSLGVTNVQVPMEPSPLGLVKELHMRRQLNGARVLCPVPLVRKGLKEPTTIPNFLLALQRGGAEAIRLNVYQTSPGAEAEVEKQLLIYGQIDAIAFSSIAEAQGLAHIMGGRDVIKSAVEEHKILLAAHGPYTAAGASHELQCPVDCVNKDFSSFSGLVFEMQKHFAGPNSILMQP